jgi:1,4-dihydroxy-2-naphthoate octaprenyltransferase
MSKSNLNIWIEAARPRTLPLSLSGIVLGSGFAYSQGFWSWPIFVLAILTTVLFQIISNFANDLGDGIKGTDNKQRVGPARSVQSGKIDPLQMKKAIIITSILSLISASALIFIGSRDLSSSVIYFYLVLTGLCIIAAITYTMGKRAYGYYGLGDLMVLLFFGGVSVLGVYPFYTKTFDNSLIYGAIGIGLMSTAVLNLNNMRDRVNDAKCNKRTLAVMMGPNLSKVYHFFLIAGGIGFLTYFISSTGKEMAGLGLLPSLYLIFHLRQVMQIKDAKLYDPELMKVALSTFLSALLFLIGILIS